MLYNKAILLLAVLVTGLALVAAACGGDEETGGGGETATETEAVGTGSVGEATGDLGDARVFPLDEQNDSGMSGDVTISPTGDNSVRVAIDVQGGDGGPHPAHIHSGSCDELGDVVYPLESVEEGTSTTAVDVSLDELENGDYAVNVHKSEDEIETYVACTNL